MTAKERINEIIALGEARLKSAKDDSIRMLRPAPVDWLAQNEIEELTDLQAKVIQQQYAVMGCPKERVEIKRMLRQLQTKFDPRASLAELRSKVDVARINRRLNEANVL